MRAMGAFDWVVFCVSSTGIGAYLGLLAAMFRHNAFLKYLQVRIWRVSLQYEDKMQ
jgi:hypothetical protein